MASGELKIEVTGVAVAEAELDVLAAQVAVIDAMLDTVQIKAEMLVEQIAEIRLIKKSEAP